MKFTFLKFLLLVAITTSWATNHSTAFAGKKVALLVGVNKYVKRGLANKPLLFAERDVQKLSETLKKQGFQVHLMTSNSEGKDQATRANILEAINKLLTDINADDIVFIGFAGHGTQLPLFDKEGKTIKDRRGRTMEDAYFCPTDAVLGDHNSLISLTKVVDTLDQKGGINLVMIDACRDNPDPGRSTRSISGNELNGRLPANTSVVFSCSASQQAFETKDAGGGHGVFFFHVLKGLQGDAADKKGEVNWERLVLYVRQNVNEKAKEWFPDRAKFANRGRLQTPHAISNLIETPILARVEIKKIEPKKNDDPKKTTTDPKNGGGKKGPNMIAGGKTDNDPPKGKVDPKKGPTEPKGPHPLLKTITGPRPSMLKAPFSRQMVTTKLLDWERFLKKKRAETDANGISFVLIPPGEFQMGSQRSEIELSRTFPGRSITHFQREKPIHSVRISKPFYMSTYELTREQWRRVIDSDPWIRSPKYSRGENQPVTMVSWEEIQVFIQRLNEIQKKVKYRLPTESEWEYACRAGTTSLFYSGDNTDSLKDYAWFEDNASKVAKGDTMKVGQKLPNNFGLFDMHGNVFEWCNDIFSHTAYRDSVKNGQLTNPSGPRVGDDYVFRGGSTASTVCFIRSSNRQYAPSSLKSPFIGFRLVKEIVEPKVVLKEDVEKIIAAEEKKAEEAKKKGEKQGDSPQSTGNGKPSKLNGKHSVGASFGSISKGFVWEANEGADTAKVTFILDGRSTVLYKNYGLPKEVTVTAKRKDASTFEVGADNELSKALTLAEANRNDVFKIKSKDIKFSFTFEIRGQKVVLNAKRQK